MILSKFWELFGSLVQLEPKKLWTYFLWQKSPDLGPTQEPSGLVAKKVVFFFSDQYGPVCVMSLSKKCLTTVWIQNAELEYKSVVTSGNTWLLWAKLWRSWRMGSGRSGGGSSPLEPLCASCTAGHGPVGAPLTSEWHSRLVPNRRPFKQSAFVSISLRRALQ